ncbi:cytochrome P450 77A3-like [Tripterygium wilfordii]|uniref:Cytochrome P450 77A3-like n=1 Tax=Tripterygium wilfordii TaxID=458696 RepID=A0A7J7D8C5_TRIWF|nr:cytochrome P450 77A3-like [Tripterygium wilfordii]KAF5742597.1 cytochrome P450 77A3-like [Tripterygium wilfordii]
MASLSLDSYYHLLLSVLAVFVSGLILLLSIKSKSKRLNLPPGPPGWPVVGNLFQVARSGKQFFEYVEDLRKTYGPIFTLKMGTRTLIFISNGKLVHKALMENGSLFHSRPRETPTRTIFSCDKFTVNAAVYGPVWQSLRRNMVQNMLSSSRLKEFRDMRNAAMDKLINRLRDESEANNGAVWVLKNARFAFFRILLGMCFGIEMDEKTIEKMDELMKTVLMVLDPRIDDYLPILSPLFPKQRKRVHEVRQQQIDFIVPFIEQRREALKNPGSDKTAMSFSYLDTLFDLKIKDRKSAPSQAELVTLCSEFLNGGTDTTGTGIEWGIAELISNPEIQSKLYEEIKQTVGDRKVEETDVDNMVYLQAVVKELLRKHPPTYLSLTHAVTEPAKLGGYDIPTDANVEIYLPGISKDPEVWSDPDKFDPERFLKEEETTVAAVAIKMMPFGVGRRICPGLAMATVHVHLMIARMVQEFEWSAYPPEKKLDFSGKLAFTVVMKDPLRAMIKPRVV